MLLRDVTASLNHASFQAGTRWYRTRDCLERLGSGYQYAGRADTNVKVGGGDRVESRKVEAKIMGFTCFFSFLLRGGGGKQS